MAENGRRGWRLLSLVFIFTAGVLCGVDLGLLYPPAATYKPTLTSFLLTLLIVLAAIYIFSATENEHG